MHSYRVCRPEFKIMQGDRYFYGLQILTGDLRWSLKHKLSSAGIVYCYSNTSVFSSRRVKR